MTQLEVYNEIYKANKEIFIEQDMTEDKASRRANKIAVQRTWAVYNDIKSKRK